MQKPETIYRKDLDNKKLFVTREFDAPVEKVWDAWTKTEILDKWWAPKPWKAETKERNFSEGGRWLYAMVGPEGERHYAMAEYSNIVPGKSFEATDAFTDENGKLDTNMPSMYWKCNFIPVDNKTRVDIVISFKEIADMEKIAEMGFKEGFAAAHENLDELLAK